MSYHTLADDGTPTESVPQFDFSMFENFKFHTAASNSTPDRRLQAAANAMQWVGYTIAVVSLFLVMTGGTLWILALGTSTAFIGSVGSVLAHELGPRRWLKGFRVKDVLTPVELEVPYHTRIENLIKMYSFADADCCFIVKRDGHVLGMLLPEDLLAVDPGLHSARAEHHMRPVDWVASVNVDDAAAAALEHMGCDRDFLAVTEGDRMVGIVRKVRIAETVTRLSATASAGERGTP